MNRKAMPPANHFLLSFRFTRFIKIRNPNPAMTRRNPPLRLPRIQTNSKRRGVEEDHKPSSVIPIPPFSGSWEDGHLSRVLIAQGLKRPYPFRLCTEAIASRQN